MMMTKPMDKLPLKEGAFDGAVAVAVSVDLFEAAHHSQGAIGL